MKRTRKDSRWTWPLAAIAALGIAGPATAPAQEASASGIPGTAAAAPQLPAAATAAAPQIPAAADSVPPAARPAPLRLPVAASRDVHAKGQLFARGLPVTAESFSPDGFHFSYIHTVPGGFLRRKPRRCAFLVDLTTGELWPTRTPKGDATRLGGWDPTGRYVLLETSQLGLLSSLTGTMTTYHWIYDVVTSDFVPRRSFAGVRDGQRFRWKIKKTYHGAWGGEDSSLVWPLYAGELSEQYQEREQQWDRETERRQALASGLAVGSGPPPHEPLSRFLPRLDEHWTQRGQRDPVVSELFGERPIFYFRDGDEWIEIYREVEYVAVLDHGTVLLTGQGGAQVVFCPERWELLLLPPLPPAFIERLENRWDRSGTYYDEDDPLPRDLQYRRSTEPTKGAAHYFNYVTPDRSRLIVTYALGPEERILRIVDLPEAWRRAPGLDVRP